jgi:aromatic-amino-acid transaminase
MSNVLSSFATLQAQPADALLGLITQFRSDPRADKIDLGVGVYRDETGATPVLRAVKAADAVLLAEQDSKGYLAPEGDAEFTRLLAGVVLGETIATDVRLTGVQTPGGTGALRLGADLIALARPAARVWIGAPTWPNHAPIFAQAGLEVRPHRFFDAGTGSIDFAGMIEDLAQAAPGDILLLHGCCHNPTGADFSRNEWATIAAICVERGLVPFIDLAYQGLGDGLDIDAAETRRLLAAVPDALVAYSCDKNFGLYRERVGAFWFWSADPVVTATARSNILSMGRSLWSMPPDHGAAIVRIILQSPALRAQWLDELDTMRSRLNSLRQALGDAHRVLASIGTQRGMFAMLPLSPQEVASLRDAHGIYMAASGRINIAGLRLDIIPALVAALSPVLEKRSLPDDVHP